MGTMQRLFQLMSEKKASDMFMAVGSPINIKIQGTLVPVNQQVMDVATIRTLLEEIIKPDDFVILTETQELNTAVGAPGIGRFRVSVFLPARRPLGGSALHPERNSRDRDAGAAAHAAVGHHGKARPDARGWLHRLGQVDHDCLPARLSQPHFQRPHPDAGRSGRICFQEQEDPSSTSARSAPMPRASKSR